MALVFDLETDGLLDTVTVIHTMTIYDEETGEYTRYDTDRVGLGVDKLHGSDVIGHNILGYDVPVLHKLYPECKPRSTRDTLVLSRLAWPDIKKIDMTLFKKGKLPGNLVGRYSLESFGHRLGMHKGTYGKQKDAWARWSQEMSDYCEQDVRLTVKLLEKVREKGIPEEVIELEHEVQRIMARQMAHGILFDVVAAQQLYAQLLPKLAELRDQLQEVFPPWYQSTGQLTPKRDNKARGYIKGCPLTKVSLIEFNPGSRHHIVFQFKKRYGWEPEEFTKSGEPKVDDDVIKALPYPEAPPLVEYLTVTKRLGQIADGKKAWLKMVKGDGRIYGWVNPQGAATGRMTHSEPNMTQVPRVTSPYGTECRSLFYAPPGYVLVGADAASLELRCLSHFMFPWDKGAYGLAAVQGNSDEGTDVHTINQKAIGAPTRNDGKTWFYAFIYGAGDKKLGKILLQGKPGNAHQVGAKSRSKFKKNLPALGKLGDAVAEGVRIRGHLLGIDKRKVVTRSAHSALNFVLQGAGAILMKTALVILDGELIANGLKNTWHTETDYDYEFVINAHDEYQLEVKKGLEDAVGKMAVEAITKAGEHFNWRIPLDGEYKVGRTWADTH